MKRRQLIALLGGAGVAWSLKARSQQPAKLPTIGFLVAGAPSPYGHGQWVAAFVQGLRELGWIEGQTVAIEFRWAEGRTERYVEIAREFVQLKVDVIVTSATPPSVAIKQATSVIPIVFASAGDPVGAGLVASLARPGGNVTGLALQSTELTGKRLELLREVLPGLRRLALLGNPDNPSEALEMHQLKATARTLTLEVITLDVKRPEDIVPAFEALRGRAEALYVISNPLTTTHQVQINALALAARMPTMHHTRDYIETGGLMSYGPNFRDNFRRAAGLVDKILRGTKPADIPVEQPTKFDLVFNLTTAKALGLTIPPTLLARADEVIE
jgi:putative ABC transport system substrate-binding protein